MVGRFSIYSRKISHWEIFLESAYCLLLKGAFLLQKHPLLQSKTWIVKFTRKGAYTDKEFRTLRSATRGVASGHHELFVKSSSKNFCFFTASYISRRR